MRSSRLAWIIAVVAIGALATAAWLFPRAMPIVALEQSVTRDIALSRADSFFHAHDLAPTGARTAVRFHGNDSLRTFIELAGGGEDTLNALVRGKDIAPFFWSVRAFVPGEPREARVDFAPDGRVIGFNHKLAEADKRPAVSADSGRRLAEHVLDSWIADRADRWRLVTSSYEIKKQSSRVDRSYTFERRDRRIGGAPLRSDVVIAGDTPIRARSYVEIPQSFARRYGEMRSANDLLALIAGLGILAIAIAGLVFLFRSAKERDVRWREPAFVGSVIGVLTLAAGLNEMPGSWFNYDTAMSPVAFEALITLSALAMGALTTLLVSFTLATAEGATRRAFPWHLDWWKLWKYRGTNEVAARVAGGYAASCIAFAYVAVFYLVTRKLLGWWVPSELLDDPNQIASPLPWISGIAASLNAGVWEEALFRALPLSLLSLWVGQRPKRVWWMAAGVIVSALIFGFAHSNYDSWPPYSRGVEIFLDACFWGVLFLNFGILVTVIAHFAYDLVLFGLFASAGSASEYRISAAIILLVLFAPALAVIAKWARERGLVPAPDDARFAAWRPDAVVDVIEVAAPRESRVLTVRARQFAMIAVLAGVVVAVARPPRATLGPAFTADRARVEVVGDSVLGAHGGNPANWKRLLNTATDTLPSWPRFLRENKIESEAQRIASTYHPPAWWIVRYVRTDSTAAQRAEEWRIRLWPDGRPLDTRHIIPDSAHRTSVDSDAVRRIALEALVREGVNTSTLQEAERKEVARPARRDVTVTFTDTAVKLPSGAVARAWVQIAGDEPLVARRGIELPEAFLRADRARQTNRVLIAGLAGLLLVGGIVAGALFVTRRRTVALNDGVLTRSQTFAFLGSIAVLAALDRLQSLPTQLFSYDTSEPWSRFLGTTVLGFVAVIPIALFVLGAWLMLGALRRRVGVPLLSGSASSNDMLVAGLGLGALVFAALRFDAVMPAGGIPHAPTTLLDQAVPILGSIAGIPASTAMLVALIGIPLLVIAGLSPRWTIRVALALAVLVLLTVVVAATASPSDSDPARVIALVVGLALIALGLRAWGALSAMSWIIAVLAFRALGELRLAVYAPTTQERIAGALTVVVACALIWLVVGRTRRVSS
ncbi:MAG: CPBP family intramembrane glutamic endopeptidase [bacterium]